MSNEKKPFWESNIFRAITFFGAIVGIIAQLRIIVETSPTVGPEFFRIVLAGLNAIALLAFCFFSTKIQGLHFEKDTNGHDDYSKLLQSIDGDLSKEAAVNLSDHYHARVNLLVRQFNSNILYWALLLTVTYILYIFDDRRSEWHFVFKIAEDLSNFLSSVFLYLAFKVLYDKTLEDDNTRFNYYIDAIVVSGLYVLGYILFAIVKVKITVGADTVSNIFSLLSGVFNGLAMTLLFARYISMEHTVSKIDKVRYSDVITLLTTFLLPLYTLAQPLFGSFEINSFGDPQTFQNYVFLICLFGKIFFLYMTYYFIRKKLVHLYLHTVLTRHSTLNKIANCFKTSE